AFSLVAVLTIAMAIGVNAGVFTIFDLFFRPLPVKDPDALVQIDLGHRAFKMEQLAAFPEYIYLRDHAKTFSGIAAVRNDRLVLGWENGPDLPRRVYAQYASGNFLPVLGNGALFGTTEVFENDVHSSSAVVLLSYHLWQGQCLSDRGIVGKRVRLNGQSFTVAGVMPRDFAGFGLEEQDGERPGAFAPRPDPDLWLPLTMYPLVRHVDPEISGVIFGLNPLDFVAYAAVSVLFAALATVALSIPALRGTRVGPMAAIRM
ncbi:MAG: ABC transporter permease, partial [Blastocatellia bacterium]